MPAQLLIGGIAYTFVEDQHDLTNALDERQRFKVDVIDYSGQAHFVKGEQVVVSDPTLGIIFSGYVYSDKEVPQYPSGAILHTIDCIDQRYLADKRTYTRTYPTSSLAGKIVVDHLHDVLLSEGIVQNFALRFDTAQADFAQGTLSGTVGASNAGDGDLELTPAGRAVTYSENTTSAFAAGTLVNCVAANNTLAPVSVPSVKMVAVMAAQQLSQNTQTAVMIWLGSQAVSGATWLEYDVFINPASPQAKMAVDLTFSDGSTFSSVAAVDAQFIPCGATNDLTGLATVGWYHRRMSVPAKTVVNVIIVCAGTNPGTYTGYFKNVVLTGATTATFFSSTLNVNPPQQLQTFGFSSTLVTIAQVYDLYTSTPATVPTYGATAYKQSNLTLLDPVGILRSSVLTYRAAVPNKTALTVAYSIDSGQSYLLCTNGAPLPGLPPGTNIIGMFLQFLYSFYALPGASPEDCPTLFDVELMVNPAAQASKSDTGAEFALQTEWLSGTLTNTLANSNNELQLNGAIRTWDDGSTANQTLLSASGVLQTVNNRSFMIWNIANGNEAKIRIDSLGQAANFTADLDIRISDANVKYGFLYRTTGWNTNEASFAYRVFLTTTKIEFGKGTNGGANTYTSLTSFPLTLATGSWHHLRVQAGPLGHAFYLDGVNVLSFVDSTYTAAGFFGFQVVDSNTDSVVRSAFFDNLGQVASLSGTWISPATSLTTAGSYGNSIVTWRDKSLSYNALTNTSILVEASYDGGSTYQTCRNGSALPNLMVGQSLSGLNLVMRITLSTATASSLAALDYFVVRVLGAYSSSGTRSTAPLGNDLMLRANQSGWGTAFDGQTWTKVGTGTDAITSNEGTISNTTGDVHEVLGSRTWTDEEGTCRFQLSSTTISGGMELRYVDANNYYRCTVSAASGGTISILKLSSGITFPLQSVSFPLAIATAYRLRFRVVGSSPVNLYAKVWLDGTLEPGVSNGVMSTTNPQWSLTAQD